MIKRLKNYLQKHPQATASDLIDILELIEQENEYDYADGYDYDDEYEKSDEVSSFTYNKPEPFTLSKKMIKDDVSLQILTTNSWLYLYGYHDDSLIEETLCINHIINGIASGKVINSGLVTRFEVVSDKDLFYYVGGSVGSYRPHSMLMSNTTMIKDSTFTLHNFTIEE